MICFQEAIEHMRINGLSRWADSLEKPIQKALDISKNGNLQGWLDVFTELPAIKTNNIDFDSDVLRIGNSEEVSVEIQNQIECSLRNFIPWRKGPFDVFGVYIDSEWRSDFKWNRLFPFVKNLKGRRVLDVGSGNGYFALRMASKGAKVFAVDPHLLYLMQFESLMHFVQNRPCAWVLPVPFEQLPIELHRFDTVFSMGVLYHRKSPFDHLQRLRDALASGGQLVLETIIIDGGVGKVLVPDNRYAKMNNVWFLPSTEELVRWMRRCSFCEIKVVDVAPTTFTEQRQTDWARFQSLEDFLDPNDSSKTVEGYPAPKRVVITATAP